MSDRPTPDDFRAKVFRDREHIGDWRVEKLNDDGESYDVAIFSGAQARERAIRYADREYAAFDEIELELEPYKRLTEDQIAAELSELWSALQAIREAVEELAPPSSVPNGEYLGPEPMREAEAIVRGIHAIAARSPAAISDPSRSLAWHGPRRVEIGQKPGVVRGTGSSNPSPSSGESGANSTRRFGDQPPVSSLSRSCERRPVRPVERPKPLIASYRAHGRLQSLA